MSSSVLCSDSFFEGDITIGTGNVFHPRCRIDGTKGPIRIGNDNIIEEMVSIVNEGSANVGDLQPLVIGNGNHFLVAAHIRGQVGNGNIVEEKGRLLCFIGKIFWG